MTKAKTRILIISGLAGAVLLVSVIIGARILAGRFEPYIRDQAIQYLKKRFDSDVELAALRVRLPNISPLKMVLHGGKGQLARVEGEGLSLRHRRLKDDLPLFVMKRFSFDVDLGTLFGQSKIVPAVVIDGMDVNIPPKDERPEFDSSESDQPETGVVIEDVLITNSKLMILPKEKGKKPLQFDLHQVHLRSAGKNVAMKYEATLTNAKPPGEIDSKGTFGPWAATEPGDTPLAGNYAFDNADLGVFDGIAGILHSTGEFKGTLNSINVHGEASVPKFQLKSAGNAISLTTQFDVLVDGTNGNTILKPVVGRIGTTTFTTSGGVIKHEPSDHRMISLQVNIPNGSMRDILTLSMKGRPFMEGRLSLNSKIDIPPLNGKVKHKLRLEGQFEVSKARFLQSKLQHQIDTFSRRGQGRPEDEEIVDVASGIGGSFHLANEVFTFRSLSSPCPAPA